MSSLKSIFLNILIIIFLLLSVFLYFYVHLSNEIRKPLKTYEDNIIIEIKNGYNSKNIIISQFLWYLKKMLPESLGGFKNNLV